VKAGEGAHGEAIKNRECGHLNLQRGKHGRRVQSKTERIKIFRFQERRHRRSKTPRLNTRNGDIKNL